MLFILARYLNAIKFNHERVLHHLEDHVPATGVRGACYMGQAGTNIMEKH